MNPQDRPARRFDEPPAYEDLELRAGDWAYLDELGRDLLREHERREHERRELARRSHLGAIVIVAAIVGLALIAVALFVRGAS